jgi:predicted TPR repeat methyltransferase
MQIGTEQAKHMKMVNLGRSARRFRSSGDLIADQRFGYAEAYAARGDHQAACDLLEQVLERAPLWPAAWIALGRAREALACRDGVISAFARAAALDQQDELGANLHLARLGAVRPPAIAPEAYVKSLFDQYAERFDAHLVGKLSYRAPGLLADAVAGLGHKQFAHAVDLGCGTGLCGAAFRARAKFLTGVDLSPAMIESARGKGLYDHLVVQSLSAFLASEAAASADLLLGADVLVYVGDLDPVFHLARRVLRENGVFAFTLQSAENGFCLGPDMRYGHAPAYVREAAEKHGFGVAEIATASCRYDAGAEVEGLVVVLETNPRDAPKAPVLGLHL